jgi:hypothetical protein
LSIVFDAVSRSYSTRVNSLQPITTLWLWVEKAALIFIVPSQVAH